MPRKQYHRSSTLWSKNMEKKQKKNIFYVLCYPNLLQPVIFHFCNSLVKLLSNSWSSEPRALISISWSESALFFSIIKCTPHFSTQHFGTSYKLILTFTSNSSTPCSDSSNPINGICCIQECFVIVLSNVTAAIVSNNSIPLLLFLKVATHISNWRNDDSRVASLVEAESTTQRSSAWSLLPSGTEKWNDNADPSPRWLNHSGISPPSRQIS